MTVEQFSARGFAKYYDSNGRELGLFIVMSVPKDYGGTLFAFYNKGNGKFIFSETNANFLSVNDGPNGIKYITTYTTDMGDKYYVGPIKETIDISI